MQIEQVLPLDEMATAVDRGRRSINRIDLSDMPRSLGDISSATLAAARDTIPGPWSRPKPRWRWPFVGLLLLLGTAVIGLTFLAPALRRRVIGGPAAGPTTDGDLAFDTELTRDASTEMDSDSAGTVPVDGFAYLADRPVTSS